MKKLLKEDINLHKTVLANAIILERVWKRTMKRLFIGVKKPLNLV